VNEATSWPIVRTVCWSILTPSFWPTTEPLELEKQEKRAVAFWPTMEPLEREKWVVFWVLQIRILFGNGETLCWPYGSIYTTIIQKLQMSYQLIDDCQMFPTMDLAQLSIHDERQLSAEMQQYLSDSPDKMRTTGTWLWQAPNKIKRLASEPGFLMACKYMGMGHYNYLIWNHSTNKWYTTTLGGANRPDAESAYIGWTSQQQEGIGSTIKEWMYKFNQD